MTPLQRSNLQSIVENIYPSFYPGRSNTPANAERLALARLAADPNTSPRKLWMLTPDYPSEVWNNIVMPLLALEDPATFAEIKQRYLQAMRVSKALEKTHSDARLGYDTWFQQKAWEYATNTLHQITESIEEGDVYTEPNSWPTPANDQRWEWDADWEDFGTAYHSRFGNYPPDKVVKTFFERVEAIVNKLIKIKQQYIHTKTNEQSTEQAIIRLRGSLGRL